MWNTLWLSYYNLPFLCNVIFMIWSINFHKIVQDSGLNLGFSMFEGVQVISDGNAQEAQVLHVASLYKALYMKFRSNIHQMF